MGTAQLTALSVTTRCIGYGGSTICITSSHSILRNESVKKRCCATTAAVSSAENIAAPTKARAKNAAAAAAVLAILQE